MNKMSLWLNGLVLFVEKGRVRVNELLTQWEVVVVSETKRWRKIIGIVRRKAKSQNIKQKIFIEKFTQQTFIDKKVFLNTKVK